VFVTTCGVEALAEAERDPPRWCSSSVIYQVASRVRVAETLRRVHAYLSVLRAWQQEQYARAAELVGAVR